MISPDDLSLYKLTDSVEEAVDEILQFFSVYHSMRYVKNKLVLRLKEAASPATARGHQRRIRRHSQRRRIHRRAALWARRRTSRSWPPYRGWSSASTAAASAACGN